VVVRESQAVPEVAVKVEGNGPAVIVKVPVKVPGDVKGIVAGAATGPVEDEVTVRVMDIVSGAATPTTVTATVEG
jgi:hypothetical protein